MSHRLISNRHSASILLTFLYTSYSYACTLVIKRSMISRRKLYEIYDALDNGKIVKMRSLFVYIYAILIVGMIGLYTIATYLGVGITYIIKSIHTF